MLVRRAGVRSGARALSGKSAVAVRSEFAQRRSKRDQALTATVALWHRSLVRAFQPAMFLSSLALAAVHLSACGVVERGDNFVAPELQIDEDRFYCEIQPMVIAAFKCAGGEGAAESGSCHTQRSALRLDLAGETDPPPVCTDGVPDPATIPASYMANFDAVRTSVQSNALSSPFYLRPTNQQSHPRLVFDVTSPEAMLVLDWLNAGAR